MGAARVEVAGAWVSRYDGIVRYALFEDRWYFFQCRRADYLWCDYFDRGVQLLADNQLHPLLLEKDFRTVQQKTASVADARWHSPGHIAQRALKKALLPDKDPTLREATAEKIRSLTLQDVKNYYRRVFRPDLTTIVVMWLP